MGTPATINLIRTKTSSSPQFDAIETSLRRTAYIALIAFLCVGVLTALVYFLFTMEYSNLTKVRSDLVARINAVKNKEGILIAIKDRTKIVEAAMSSQKPWTQVLDLVSPIAQPPTLSSFSVDEQNKVLVSIKAESLDEVLTVVETLIDYAKEGKILFPQLLSFQVGKTGALELSFSFFAQFQPL